MEQLVENLKNILFNPLRENNHIYDVVTDAVCELIKKVTQKAFGIGGKKRKTSRRFIVYTKRNSKRSKTKRRNLVNKKKKRTHRIKY